MLLCPQRSSLSRLWFNNTHVWTHVAADGISSFFFTAERYSLEYMYGIFLVHSSEGEYLACLHVLAIVSSTALGVHVSFESS